MLGRFSQELMRRTIVLVRINHVKALESATEATPTVMGEKVSASCEISYVPEVAQGWPPPPNPPRHSVK